MSHLSVILCGLAQAVRDVYSTNQNILLNPLISQHSLPPLQRENDFVYALFIFFVSSVPSPFLYFFAFCTSSPSLFCFWLGNVTHKKYSSRGEKCWARHLPHLSYSEKQHRKLCERGKHGIKNEANLALSFVEADNYKNVSYNCHIKVSFFCNHIVVYVC